MKLLIGRWESGGHWHSVIIGLFDNDELLDKAKNQFTALHEGHNYNKTEVIELELNKQMPF